MPAEVATKVIEVIQRNYNVKSVRVERALDINFKAGQFLQVTLQNNPQLKHYLSISSSPTEKCHLEFTKKLSQSDFSKSMDALKAGDELKIQYPFGKFTLEDNPASKIAFISGGIGITPLRSIAKDVVDRDLGTDMVLIYSNRSIKDIVFKDDFSAMQKAYAKLRVAHVLCEAEPGFKCSVGYINASIIRNEVPDYKERKFFLCGPPTMVEAMRKMLSDEIMLSSDQIVTENFQGY